MKLRSLYQFYKKFFNLNLKSNRFYGRAVSETNLLVREMMEKHSIIPILQYYRRDYVNPITVKLVNKLIEIAEQNYCNPFEEIDYFETWIMIDKGLLSSKRRGLQIPVTGGIDRKNKRLILLVFKSCFNLLEENKVLAGLIREFPITNKFPTRIYRISYWNLSKGEVKEVDTRALIPASRESLIEAANKF